MQDLTDLTICEVDQCANVAVVHLTEIVQRQANEHHYCEDCAQTTEIFPTYHERHRRLTGRIRLMLEQEDKRSNEWVPVGPEVGTLDLTKWNASKSLLIERLLSISGVTKITYTDTDQLFSISGVLKIKNTDSILTVSIASGFDSTKIAKFVHEVVIDYLD